MGHGLFINGGALQLAAEVSGHHPGQLAEIAHAFNLLELVIII